MPPISPSLDPVKTTKKTAPPPMKPAGSAQPMVRPHSMLPREPREQAAAARPGPTEKRNAALGWFSVGLGLAQLLAPKQMAGLIGVDEDDDVNRLALRLIGVREFACGVGLLSQSHSAAWAWARVAGDVLDLALLGRALQSPDSNRERVLASGAAVLGVACADVYAAYDAQRTSDVGLEGIEVRESVTIARPPEVVYAFFRNFENLPKFMSHVKSVRVANGHSHWSVHGPLGTTVAWDAETVEDRPNSLIVWRSLPNADVSHQGRVELRAMSDGDTELDIVLRYDPPAGKVGAAIAGLLGAAPGQQISSDLRRLKQVLETGEVLHSDASIHRGMHSAQPSELSARISAEVGS